MPGFINISSGPALFRPYRAIGPFVASVTVRERHTDRLVITENPVETGAAVSDHAYKLPAEVMIEAGWDANNNLQSVYAQLLALQAQRQPFTVYTGKRMYADMLVGELEVETDENTENVLIVTATIKQIILVSTSSVDTSASLNSSNMTMPQQTAPTQSQGTQQAKPTNAFSPDTAAT